MKIITHRGLWTEVSQQNTLAAFKLSQQENWGIETDLRSFQGKLFLSHDPLKSSTHAPSLEDLLNLWADTPELPIFMNIKEDGLLPLLRPFKTSIHSLNIIFFDMSIPQLIQYAKEFPRSMLATRYSEHERHPAALELCQWLWVDGFEVDPAPEDLSSFVKVKKMSIAVVSPELHSRQPQRAWNKFLAASWIPQGDLAICTDWPQKLKREIR